MPYDDTNKGALFRNDDKAKDEQPDYQGSLDVDGQAFGISGWLRTSKAGRKFMSLSVKPKTEAKARPIPGRTDDDEIPF
jgi:uncharacterized protein (DUF736 family)